MKPLFSKYFLIEERILLRERNVAQTSSFEIKSSQRLRYLTSLSCNPECFSASGNNVLQRRVTFLAKTVSSPFCVRNRKPSTPRISPRSIFFSRTFSGLRVSVWAGLGGL